MFLIDLHVSLNLQEMLERPYTCPKSRQDVSGPLKQESEYIGSIVASNTLIPGLE